MAATTRASPACAASLPPWASGQRFVVLDRQAGGRLAAAEQTLIARDRLRVMSLLRQPTRLGQSGRIDASQPDRLFRRGDARIVGTHCPQTRQARLRRRAIAPLGLKLGHQPERIGIVRLQQQQTVQRALGILRPALRTPVVGLVQQHLCRRARCRSARRRCAWLDGGRLRVCAGGQCGKQDGGTRG